ncbi:putative Myosin-XV [Daphnia magna]|uniref:Putative Myosin-XV n=1 Tax=Daphnia magna TaxID=35525 RepID=A0A164TVN3_9CRUS|nr:putative Myosin-XV [Daphnia magna]
MAFLKIWNYVSSLFHWTVDLDHMASVKVIRCLLPKMALSVRDIRTPQYVVFPRVHCFEPSQAKAEVLEVLRKWLLLLEFFAVRCINQNDVHFLEGIAHVISTRKGKSEKGYSFP